MIYLLGFILALVGLALALHIFGKISYYKIFSRFSIIFTFGMLMLIIVFVIVKGNY